MQFKQWLWILGAVGFFVGSLAAAEPIVCEAEKVLDPAIQINRNRISNSKWDLLEQNIADWSGGATLRIWGVKEDCTPETSPRPTLTFHLTVPESGDYEVAGNFGPRYIAVSTDGWKNTLKVRGKAVLCRRVRLEAGKPFTIQAAVCYGTPDGGPVYVDNFVLTPLSERKASGRFEAEEVLAPSLTLSKNAINSRKWDLWTNQPLKDWSCGTTVRIWGAEKEYEPANSPRPILSFNIPVEKAECCDLVINVGPRPVAVSVDGGKTWQRVKGEAVILRGFAGKPGETVPVKVSACYATPKAPVYVDYFEWKPADKAKNAQNSRSSEQSGASFSAQRSAQDSEALKRIPVEVSFEAEKVAAADMALTHGRLRKDLWDVWSGQRSEDWTGGTVVRAFSPEKDRVAEENPVPPLHIEIPVKIAGTYELYGNFGTRPLGVSVDGGKNYTKVQGSGVLLVPAKIYAADETIDLWFSPCFAAPEKEPGTVYIDTFKLLPVTSPKASPALSSLLKPVRIEAEEVLLPGTKTGRNGIAADKWNFCTNQNPKDWSAGTMIRAYGPAEDCPAEKAKLPPLDFTLTAPMEGSLDLYVQVGPRPVGISLDGGKSYLKVSGKSKIISGRTFQVGEKLSIRLAGIYANPGNPGPVYADYFEFAPHTDDSVISFTASAPGTKPAGWKIRFPGHDAGDLLAVIRTDRGPALEMCSPKGGFWVLSGERRFPASRGQRWKLSLRVTNLGDHPSRLGFWFFGWNGASPVISYIGFNDSTFVPAGATMELSTIGTVPAKVNCLTPELQGYGAGYHFRLEDLKIERLEDVDVIAKKVDWNREMKTGKENLTLYPCIPGSAVKVAFSVRASGEKPGNGFLALRGFLHGVHMSSGLKWFDLQNVGSQWERHETALNIPCDIDALDLHLHTGGGLEFKDISIGECPAVPFARGYAKKMDDGFAGKRITEKPGRGLVALPLPDGRVYLSWRLNPGEENAAFDLFATVGGSRRKLNSAPLKRTTDFVVEKPDKDAEYSVCAVSASFPAGHARVLASPQPGQTPFRRFVLGDPEVEARDVAPADLDGDGEYDYVVWTNYPGDGHDTLYWGWRPDRRPPFLEAFHRDGRRLWNYCSSVNVENGSWYFPYVVYDINGDGKAEVILRGTPERCGDWREPAGAAIPGKVLGGPEYLMVLDGMTGKVIDYAPWPERDEFMLTQWGYTYAHRSQLAIAYLDGKTPCIIAIRGTYGLMLAEAWQMKNGKLKRIWKFTNRYLDKKYWGQGAHTTRVADLDGDGRDEIILGSLVLDDDGSALWSTGLGHPDHIYVGDLDPQNPGLEVATIVETPTKRAGISCYDGKTGRELWALEKPAQHFHYGYGGDMDARFRGWEIGGSDVIAGGHDGPKRHYHFSPEGKLLAEGEKAPFAHYRGLYCPYFAYWDADPQKELIAPLMSDFRGGPCGGRIAGNFICQFDSEGDWREEIATTLPGELRVYLTTIPATDRHVTLMADPIYRLSVAENSSGYFLDPSHGRLISDEAPGLTLTKISDTALEVTLSAPADRAVSGDIFLKTSDGTLLEPSTLHLTAGKRSSATQTVKIDRGGRQGFYVMSGKAALADGSVVNGEVPGEKDDFKEPWELPIPPPYAEAEAWSSQTGGKVLIREDKQGTHEKSISHWDVARHTLSWKLQVAEAGKYQLLFRHCGNAPARREVSVNGKSLGVLVFPATGGLGSVPHEWKDRLWEKEIELPAGECTVTLENVGDTSLNMDFLRLVRRESR